jgi:hypothetical protein
VTAEIKQKQSSKRRLKSKRLSIYITCVTKCVKLCLAETCGRRQTKRHYHLSVLEDGRRVVSETPVWRVFMFAPCINSDENYFIVPTVALNNIKL